MSAAAGLDRRIGYAAKRLQQALAVLADCPGLSNSGLARRCFVTRGTVNELLAGLQAAGLITRAAHARGGRILRTELTCAGTPRNTATAPSARSRTP